VKGGGLAMKVVKDYGIGLQTIYDTKNNKTKLMKFARNYSSHAELKSHWMFSFCSGSVRNKWLEHVAVSGLIYGQEAKSFHEAFISNRGNF
jgi:hypothetical protein